MSDSAPLTPKEFAYLVFDGKRSARWVRNECRRYVRTRGRRGIAVVSSAIPWLIPRSEVARFTKSLFEQRAERVA